jgi:hypothetical protein
MRKNFIGRLTALTHEEAHREVQALKDIADPLVRARYLEAFSNSGLMMIAAALRANIPRRRQALIDNILTELD